MTLKTLFTIFSLIFLLNFNAFSQNIESYPVSRVLSIEIATSINPAVLNYIKSSLEHAKKRGQDLLIIKINTPGGLITTTKEIISLIGEASIPIAIWVYPEGGSATSAGAIISSSAHFLFMARGTNIGAATPINMSGDIKNEDVRNKSINDLVALVSSLSEARGRSAEGFKKMIKKAESFSAIEAKKNKFIDEIISNDRDILNFVEGKTISLKGKKIKIKGSSKAAIDTLEMDIGQKILSFFANPSLAYILFILGAVLLYFELQAPGGLIAGAIGAVCLVLAGIGFQLLPLNWGAMGLILLSFVLFTLEVFITSYGVLSLGGLASLIIGSLFLFRTEDSLIHISELSMYAAISAVVVCIACVGYIFIKDLRTKRRDANDIIGLDGVVTVASDKVLKAKVAGEIWRCLYKDGFSVGDKVKVVSKEDNSLTLTVEKV